MPGPRDGQCGKMPHYCPGGWAQLELTDALTDRAGQEILRASGKREAEEENSSFLPFSWLSGLVGQ